MLETDYGIPFSFHLNQPLVALIPSENLWYRVDHHNYTFILMSFWYDFIKTTFFKDFIKNIYGKYNLSLSTVQQDHQLKFLLKE